jgi:hypothetical protein
LFAICNDSEHWSFITDCHSLYSFDLSLIWVLPSSHELCVNLSLFIRRQAFILILVIWFIIPCLQHLLSDTMYFRDHICFLICVYTKKYCDHDKKSDLEILTNLCVFSLKTDFGMLSVFCMFICLFVCVPC